MARLKKASGESKVSLFPFMNIMIGTLGCLIFIIGAVMAISFGIERKIMLHPLTYGNHGENPVYIEWDGTHVTISETQKKIRILSGLFDTFSFDLLITGSDLERLINDIGRRRMKSYIIVLVRPSGFHNFLHLRNYIMGKKMGIGYEPIPQNWKVKISKN